jgi:quinohemoprotein ethanol dehydrogenase
MITNKHSIGVRALLVAAMALAFMPPVAAGPAEPAPRIAADAAGANWFAKGGTHGETYYSGLDRITSGNIERLGLGWSHDIDPGLTSFSAPLMVDGVLYFAAGQSVVHAVDARSGKLLWKHDPEAYRFAGHKLRAGFGLHDLAYLDGRIFVGTVDGRLIALDARTGRQDWSVQTIDPGSEAYGVGTPRAFDGKVIIGFGGADYGALRGYVTTYDAATGKQLWRFHTVPGDPARGFENEAMAMAAKTWNGEWWKHGGGGTVWNAMTYDERFKRVYIGVGNGSPWNQKIRSPGGGDNLFLASIVALDADTGEYQWHYQVNPGETWDYSAAMDIELAELPIDGKLRPVLLHAPKNGFFYVIDRETGKLVSAEKFARNVNWAERIDLRTGRPVENPAARYPGGRPFVVQPGSFGAHNVQTMSFSPRTGLAYIPASENGFPYVDPPDPRAWQRRAGMVNDGGLGLPPANLKVPPLTSALVAWDVLRQRQAWRIELGAGTNGGTLATAGNLVFQGQGSGQFVAYAADSGKRLWSFDAGNGILGNPISYELDGRQYVTVITGWRGFLPPPVWDYRLQRRRVLTFALDGKASLPPSTSAELPFIDDPSFKPDMSKAIAGLMLYAQRCALCHGFNAAAAGGAPDLRRSAMAADPTTFEAVVRQGRLMAAGMPRFEELTAEELESLQHYIRSAPR